MPLYEWECPKCNAVFEEITKMDVETVKCPLCWDENSIRIFPTKAPSFKLTYNPRTDMVDWDGNRTKYWDEYKKQKAEGKKVRIPALDGDQKGPDIKDLKQRL